MKKVIICLGLLLCLTGCSTPSEPQEEVEEVSVVTEVQGNLEAFATLLSQEGALESIRHTIETGELDTTVLEFTFEDMLFPTPSLRAELVPQKDTLRMGYDWKTKTYTCLFTCLSDKEKAYVVARFDENFVCYSFGASPIVTLPYTITPTTEVDEEEAMRDYIPRPAMPDLG